MFLSMTPIGRCKYKGKASVICSPELPLDFMSAATVLVNHVCRTVSANEKGNDLCR